MFDHFPPSRMKGFEVTKGFSTQTDEMFNPGNYQLCNLSHAAQFSRSLLGQKVSLLSRSNH